MDFGVAYVKGDFGGDWVLVEMCDEGEILVDDGRIRCWGGIQCLKQLGVGGSVCRRAQVLRQIW